MAADLEAMHRYARALARNRHDADDVVQDALVCAIEGRPSGTPIRSRRRWLLAIVHNVFVSRKRREAAEQRCNDHFAQVQPTHANPAQDEQARLAQIARTFAQLPEAQRAVMHLIAVEGLSYQDAADLLALPIGTVMSRLSRGRAALRAADKNQETRSTAVQLRLVGGKDG